MTEDRPTVDHIVGVVLAAGAGSRYGMPKVLAAHGRWLDSVITSLREGGCADVLVTLGAAVVDIPSPARAVLVPRWAEGLSETVRAGVQAASASRCAGVVLHVVDVPDTSPAVVRRVIDAVSEPRSGLARAVFDGRPGHPVFIGADHLAGMCSALTGDRGAGVYLDARTDVVRVECGDLSSGRDHDVPS